MPRRPDNKSERLDNRGVSEAFLATNSVGATGYDRPFSLTGCLSAVRPVAEASLIDGPVLRETASEREAREDKSLDILGKVRQIAET